MDWAAQFPLRVPAMTDHDLIASLLTRCGMIIEDASVIALLRANPVKVADQVAAVQKAATEISTLAAAAAVMLGQAEQGKC